jgi:hypothetical protein
MGGSFFSIQVLVPASQTLIRFRREAMSNRIRRLHHEWATLSIQQPLVTLTDATTS